MSRHQFLVLAAAIGMAVGAFAATAPRILLESKGVIITPATMIWVREVGVIIFSLGIVAWMIRREPDSRTLRGVLVGNAVAQLGLLPIEIAAYAGGDITKVGGIIPNSVVHVVLAVGFMYFAWRMKIGR